MRTRARITDTPAGAAAAVAHLAAETRYYLGLTPRQLPSKYLYDALGSALFEAITCLPWYPLRRAEERLLRAHAAEVFRLADPVGTIAELGPGRGDKLLTVLDAAGRMRTAVDVRLIDVSAAALTRAAQALHAVTAARVRTYEETYEAGLDRLDGDNRGAGRMLLFFLGSNIGNFDPPGAEALLWRVKGALGRTGALLLGTDLVKPMRDLLLAYDDPLGVTAAFNRNLLVRLNRELDADFDIDAFAHRAIWNAEASRIEMHLVSRRPQRIRVGAAGFEFSLAHGEAIWTESSYKFRSVDVVALLKRAGFRVARQWIDVRDQFALTLAEPEG
jgi:dimethylhistidine N-methyltransferase